MRKLVISICMYSIFFVSHSVGKQYDACVYKEDTVIVDQQKIQAEETSWVTKRVLKNGMTVLVRVVKTIPQVAIQVWYNVGSKDEKTGERGIAHLIEHMIFKGTDTLSESDINTIAHTLSASINAATSHDFTMYRWDSPTQNWKKIIPIIADIMTNVSFKDDHLNSEMKTVIQELKMGKDNYFRSVVMQLLTTMFPDHPYHYPIIGYKQDLWAVNGDDLRKFYRKHYMPNNAALVVVGDVDPEEVFAQAEEHFGQIPANPEYKKEELYHNTDIASTSVTLYREIKQPMTAMAFVVPGAKKKVKPLMEALQWILGAGKASRLNRILVDERQLVTMLESFNFALFDHGVFFIIFEPKQAKDIPAIKQIIWDEIDNIVNDGLTDQEIERAVNQAKMQFYRTLESAQSQAYEIGKWYLATEDENYVFDSYNKPVEELEAQLRALLSDYFRPSVTHTGTVLPLPESEKEAWKKLQALSDEEDTKILSVRERTSPVEPAQFAKTITPGKPTFFNFPKAKSFDLDNGLKVLYYNNENTPKIDLLLQLKAKYYFGQEGMANFVSDLLTEGTENYTDQEFARELETRGMFLHAYADGVSLSMPREQFAKGLELLNEVLTKAAFRDEQVEKIRDQILVSIKNYWDEPSQFTGQLIKEKIYRDHPYSKSMLGKADIIKGVTRDELVAHYQKYYSPDGARLAIVGDLGGVDIQQEVKQALGNWKHTSVDKPVLPEVQPARSDRVDHPINRDQVVLCLAQPSIRRTDKDYDKLLLFNQILGGGVLGSMSSRLFQLREQSGLFYTIGGTLTASSNEEKGMVLVKTIVSVDRLEEAEKRIRETLEGVADTVTQAEVNEAKSAIINSLSTKFESNSSITRVFLFLDRYDFPVDYFDNRAKQLENISIKDIQEAVKRVLDPTCLLTVRAGRVELIQEDTKK